MSVYAIDGTPSFKHNSINFKKSFRITGNEFKFNVAGSKGGPYRWLNVDDKLFNFTASEFYPYMQLSRYKYVKVTAQIDTYSQPLRQKVSTSTDTSTDYQNFVCPIGWITQLENHYSNIQSYSSTMALENMYGPGGKVYNINNVNFNTVSWIAPITYLQNGSKTSNDGEDNINFLVPLYDSSQWHTHVYQKQFEWYAGTIVLDYSKGGMDGVNPPGYNIQFEIELFTTLSQNRS